MGWNDPPPFALQRMGHPAAAEVVDRISERDEIAQFQTNDSVVTFSNKGDIQFTMGFNTDITKTEPWKNNFRFWLPKGKRSKRGPGFELLVTDLEGLSGNGDVDPVPPSWNPIRLLRHVFQGHPSSCQILGKLL